MSSKSCSSNPINVEVFDEFQDFFLWKKKMLYVLVHYGIKGAVDNDYSSDMSNTYNVRMSKRVYHTILLHLSDDILNAMNGVKTVDSL